MVQLLFLLLFSLQMGCQGCLGTTDTSRWNDAMANVFNHGSQTQGRASEKFYYWSDRKSTISSNIVPAGQTWTGANVFFRKQVGNIEHELHVFSWLKNS